MPDPGLPEERELLRHRIRGQDLIQRSAKPLFQHILTPCAFDLLPAAHVQSIEKRRVLVVDKQPNLTDLVKLFLEKTDRYTVFVQNVSHDAFETVQRVKPHLIILDVDMPGKDGGDVARELSESREFASTPLLFFTSLVSIAEAGKHEIERGGLKFLSKPLHARAFVEAVDRNCAQVISTVVRKSPLELAAVGGDRTRG